MIRVGAIAVLAVVTLAACSQDAPERPEAAAAPGPGTPEAGPAAAGDPTSPGGGLIGEVSSLSGEITGFRVETTATETIIEIAADVLFAFDSADLSPAAPVRLARAADLIREGAPGSVRVVGYTDSVGDDDYNLDLSLRRARSVVTWLSADGRIPADRLTPEGKGEAEPVAPNEGTEGNDYPDGRAMNRRVEIVIPRA